MENNGILILGGAGFVGRSLLGRLSDGQTNIYVIVRENHSMPRLPGVQYYVGALDDVELLNDLLPKCRVVLHLASGTTPGSSFQKPSVEAELNIMPTLRFLEVLQDYNDLLLIYMSSGGAVYGDVAADKVNEETNLAPLSYYGAGKASIEKFITAFCHQTGQSGIILRPSNVYGPGQIPRAGFGLIPTLFQRVVEKKPLEIWGDGEIIRDYVYIDDLNQLIIKLIEKGSECEGVNFYNAGTGRGYTVNQLCEMVEVVTQSSLERKYFMSRAVDVKRIIMDITKVKQDYEWRPQVDLLTGLKRTWAWFEC